MKLKQVQISSPRIEMLPLIDIVFLLLVFFIYAMLSMAVHRGQTVDLPQSSSAPVEMQKAISLTIRDGDTGVELFMNDRSVSPAMLKEELGRLKLAGQGRKEPEVQVFADKSVSYQELFQVLDIIKEAGLAQISLQAQAAGSYE